MTKRQARIFMLRHAAGLVAPSRNFGATLEAHDEAEDVILSITDQERLREAMWDISNSLHRKASRLEAGNP